jgi:nitrogen fixation protein FixH
VEIRVMAGDVDGVVAIVSDDRGIGTQNVALASTGDGRWAATLSLPPGRYRTKVTAQDKTSVTDIFMAV